LLTFFLAAPLPARRFPRVCTKWFSAGLFPSVVQTNLPEFRSSTLDPGILSPGRLSVHKTCSPPLVTPLLQPKKNRTRWSWLKPHSFPLNPLCRSCLAVFFLLVYLLRIRAFEGTCGFLSRWGFFVTRNTSEILPRFSHHMTFKLQASSPVSPSVPS